MAGTNQQALSEAHQHRIDGDYESARQLYQQVIDTDKDCAEAWWGVGLTLMNLGEFEESVECLEKAVEIEPNSQRYLLDLGKHQTMLGMFDEAKPVFERIIEIDTNSREADDARNQLRYY